MRSLAAILIFSLPTVLITLLGKVYWPYTSYTLYAHSAAESAVFELWGEDQAKGERYKITNSTILWPVGPNGINQKIIEFIISGAKKEQYSKVLAYFFYRYQYFQNKNLSHLPKMDRIYLVQNQPLFNEESSNNYPTEKLSYVKPN